MPGNKPPAYRVWLRSTAICALAIATATTTMAQETGSHENITNYPPTFFAEYNPVTALDMVRQVPGFSIQNGNQARGFGGTAGNVLIDGERPSTKSTSLGELLSRIPLARVDRIELVSGSVPGMDMRGQTRVVNVVLSEATGKRQTSWSAQLTHWGKKITPTGEIIQNFKLGKADITLGLQLNGHDRRSVDTKEFVDASGTLFEYRNARDQRKFREWQPHFTLARKFGDGASFNLNGKLWVWEWQRNRISESQVPLNGNLQFEAFDFARADNEGEGLELGGDYEHKFGTNRSVKFIFLQRSDTRNFDDVFESFDTGGFDGAFRVLSSEAINESIVRSVFTWERDPKNSFEASIEGAYNWLKAGLDIEEDTGNGFVTVTLPVANTKVEERRAEAALSWITKPGTGWTIESGVKYEISEISQSGDAANAREFSFIKPSINVTWDRNETDQLRLGLSRNVGQLDFQDFATSVDITDNQTNVGNIDLRPDSSWMADFAIERKIGKKGVFILSGNHRWISDVPDLVPINNQFDAPGNIGDGTTWHVGAELRMPTDKLGIKNGILTMEGGYGDSAVTDPVTGETREQSFRVDDYYEVEFRQELSQWKMAWGFDYSKRTPFRAAFLFDERRNAFTHGDLDIFVETNRWKNVTVKLGMDNIFEAQFVRTRTNFAGTRDLGVIDNIETRFFNMGQVVYLSAKGTF